MPAGPAALMCGVNSTAYNLYDDTGNIVSVLPASTSNFTPVAVSKNGDRFVIEYNGGPSKIYRFDKTGAALSPAYFTEPGGYRYCEGLEVDDSGVIWTSMETAGFGYSLVSIDTAGTFSFYTPRSFAGWGGIAARHGTSTLFITPATTVLQQEIKTFDTSALTFGGTFFTSGTNEQIRGIDCSPDGSKLYACFDDISSSPPPSKGIYVINASTGSTISRILITSVAGVPQDVTVGPTGDFWVCVRVAGGDYILHYDSSGTLLTSQTVGLTSLFSIEHILPWGLNPGWHVGRIAW